MEIASGIFLGLVILLLLVEKARAGDTTAGDGTIAIDDGGELYPAPPPDDFSNPEVGDVISGGSGLPVTQAKIDQLAQAIAVAEGWTNPNPNVIPRKDHNPGDLTRSFGQPTTGVANSEGVLIFADDDAGWSALKAEATSMLTGASHVYKPSMTIRDVAAKYTGGDASGSWAANAARELGISPDQTLEDFLNL